MFRCHSSAGPEAGDTSYLWNMENLGLSSDHDIAVTDGTLLFHGTRYTNDDDEHEDEDDDNDDDDVVPGTPGCSSATPPRSTARATPCSISSPS